MEFVTNEDKHLEDVHHYAVILDDLKEKITKLQGRIEEGSRDGSHPVADRELFELGEQLSELQWERGELLSDKYGRRNFNWKPFQELWGYEGGDVCSIALHKGE